MRGITIHELLDDCVNRWDAKFWESCADDIAEDFPDDAQAITQIRRQLVDYYATDLHENTSMGRLIAEAIGEHDFDAAGLIADARERLESKQGDKA